MKIPTLLILVLVLIGSLAVSFAQPPSRFASATNTLISESAQSQDTCPKIKVSCPSQLKPGEVLKFVATVTGGEPEEEITHLWTVSAGSILSGQGTSQIQVDISNVPHNGTVTATVDVIGFERRCKTDVSCTTIVKRNDESSKIYEYPSNVPEQEAARLNAFAKALQGSPDSQAYVIAYGGRHSSPGAAQATGKRVKDYLVTNGGIDADRVMAVDGGYKEEEAIELWIVPPGANPPIASPTVDPSEVTPKKAPAKQTTKRRKRS